jgi:hypothetical protein
MFVGIVGAFTGPVASADRPVPDMTCATGEPATYGQGAHRFREGLLVLGCVRPPSGGRLQVDGWVERSRHGLKMTCLDLTSGVGLAEGYACPPKRPGGSGSRVLLLIRPRSGAPVLAFGVAPAQAERVAAAYTTTTGAGREASAELLRVDDELAERVGTRRGFAIFIAALGPRADVCGGITPRAFGPTGRRLIAQRADPTHRGSMGLPGGGWLVGFTPSWGIGSGSPRVCARTPQTVRESSPEPAGGAGADGGAAGQPDSTGGIPWPVVAGGAGAATLIALLAVRRRRVRQ